MHTVTNQKADSYTFYTKNFQKPLFENKKLVNTNINNAKVRNIKKNADGRFGISKGVLCRCGPTGGKVTCFELNTVLDLNIRDTYHRTKDMSSTRNRADFSMRRLKGMTKSKIKRNTHSEAGLVVGAQ